MHHEEMMHRCLELAALGRGFVGNGALVGAVLVRDGKIIAEGYHAGFGQAHAERDLLQKFTDPILPDDILYVNLEPCCPSPTKKTPPCTDIILERGIKHVVYGMQDPDQRVCGKGIEILRSHGVEVFGPVSLPLCQLFNKGFTSVRTHNRPFITIKKAVTHDGRIENADGSKLKITSEKQDIWSHTFLRSTHDAILVGIRTIITDNPRLDARRSTSTPEYHPWRIVLDRTVRIPPDAHVVSDDRRNRTLIIHGPIVDHEMEFSVSELRERGVRLMEIPIVNDIFDWSVLWQSLMTPDQNYQGLTSILVEGGEKTWNMFKEAGITDQEVMLMGR